MSDSSEPLFRSLDVNHDNELSHQEIMSSNLTEEQKTALWSFLKKYDRNRNFKIEE